MSDLRDYLEDMGRLCPDVPEFKYNTVHALLLAEGQEYDNHEPFTPEERGGIDRLLEVMGRPRFKSGDCFFNAWTLAEWASPEGILGVRGRQNMLVPAVQYVEGYAIHSAVPVLHAWVTVGGKVLDLTWMPHGADGEGRDTFDARHKRHNRTYAPQRLIDRSQQLVLADGAEYWGIAVPLNDMRRHLVRVGRYSPIIDDYADDYPLLRSGLPASWKRLTATTAPDIVAG
jgi:hypothetical protein